MRRDCRSLAPVRSRIHFPQNPLHPPLCLHPQELKITQPKSPKLSTRYRVRSQQVPHVPRFILQGA